VTWTRIGSSPTVSLGTTESGPVPTLFLFLLPWSLILPSISAFVFQAAGEGKSAVELLAGVPGGLVPTLFVLGAHHARMFYEDFIRGPSWVRRDPAFHAFPPFRHLARTYGLLFFGGVVVDALDAPGAVLGIFVLLKTSGDLLSSRSGGIHDWRRDPPIPE
jgi:hypothetical protein